MFVLRSAIVIEKCGGLQNCKYELIDIASDKDLIK